MPRSGSLLRLLVHVLSFDFVTASWQVSCKWPSTLDTTANVELDWSKPQDIASVPVASAKSSVVEPLEMVHRDVAVPIIEAAAKTEQPCDTLVHHVVLADNQSDGMLTVAPEQKSGDSDVSVNEELLPESPTAEPLLVPAVDEYGAEFKTDDLPTTTSAITSNIEETSDVAGTESLTTGIQSLHADHHVLESVTERIKPSAALEERALPLDTPVSAIMDREIPTELNEEISEEIDFPTANWSLTALHFNQSTLKTDVLSTTAFAVQSDAIPEADEPAVDSAKAEGKIEMELEGREMIRPANLPDELHDAETSVAGKPKGSLGSDKSIIYGYSLEQESHAVEGAHRKQALTSDSCDLMSYDRKMPKKKVAALILDTDAVHIRAAEVLGSADNNAGRIDSASNTGYNTMLSQQVTLETSDETRKEFDSHASLDQQELDHAGNVVDSTKSSQPPEENIDSTLQTLVLSGQTTETQILTKNSEPNTTHVEREGTWTTNLSPQEVQRAMEPMTNGPLETQCRYVILERGEGLEICQESAAETHVPACKLGGVITDVSELEVMENAEKEIGKESDETEYSERVSLNAKKQSETLEIIETLPVLPASRKPERLSFSTEDKLEEDVDKVIVEVENTEKTAVKCVTKPTPPTRQSKECERLLDSSDIQSEDANLPVPASQQYEHDETQLPPAEVLPAPPNARCKVTLGDERLSANLDSQPSPPERRQKEKVEHQQLELKKTIITAVEEPHVKPVLPERQKISEAERDGIPVVSKTQKMEEILVKPAPPTRKRDVTEPVSGSSNLDKTRTKVIAVEESLEKPTPPVRRKASPDETAFIDPLMFKPQGTEYIPVKPTLPIQRKDSGNVRETISEETASQISKSAELEKTVTQERAVGELLVKPTPPVRRKGSQVSEIQEMVETLVKPTPPARRRDSRNFSDGAYEDMASKISRSTDMEKTETQEKALEEPLIKPTPPVRRKVSSRIESDTVSVLSKIQEAGENVVKPTPPTRRRDSRNMSDIVAINISSSTDLQETVSQEEALLKSTPPVRQKPSQARRRNSGNMADTAVRRIFGSCDLENSTLVSPERAVEETLGKPTPPVRRKTSRAESDISIVYKTEEMEETLVKPTPPARRRDSRNVSDTVAIKSCSCTDLENSVTQGKSVQEPVIKVTPPARRKTSPAESGHSKVSKTQEMEDTLVKPTPPTRRESKNGSDTVACKISDSNDLERSVTQDCVTEQALVKPAPPAETLVKPTPPTHRSDSRNVDEIVPKQIEGDFSSSIDLDRAMTKEGVDMEALVKLTSPVEHESSQAQSDLSIVDKTQEIEETLAKPTVPTRTRDGRNVDETVPKQMERDISSSTDLEMTVTQELAEEEGLVKLTPPVGQEASQDESQAISSMLSKSQEPEETPVKHDVSPTEMQDILVEPILREDQNEVEHESIKVSSVGTEPEEILPKPTTRIDQRENTAGDDLDAIPIVVEQPPIQPTPPNRTIENSIKIHSVSKQEDEQPEKDLCSALGMESTEGLTESKSINLFEVTGNCMYVEDVPGIRVLT